MMAKSEPLTLTLPEPLAREVRRVVERGDYPEPGEVVAAALSDWIERGSPPAMTPDRLRELIEEAEQAGEAAGDFEIDELLEEARRTSAPKR